jgi:NAD(P)-dependent dehydrogenase (short-subunit alcohol dehydrogenase family)
MLGSEGYSLTVTSRRPDRLDPAAEALRSKGYPVRACVADVMLEDDISRVVADHETAWGRLDVLVNSAGGGIVAPAGELDDFRTDRQLNLNLRSTIFFVHRCLPLIRKTATPESPALIVNMSSLGGKQAAPSLTVYAAAKHGLVGFTTSLNAELASTGIRATVLCPEIVDTPLTDHPFFSEHLHMTTSEMIKVEDITESIRFLLRLSPACVVPELVFRNVSTLGDR